MELISTISLINNESKIWKSICEVFSRIWNMDSLRICNWDRMAMIWFYLHCVTAIVIVIADARGTLEPTINKWEKKLGIPVPEEVDVEAIIREQ